MITRKTHSTAWPPPSLQLRVMLPSVIFLGVLLVGLLLLGTSWLDGQNDRLGRARAESAVRALALAPELRQALAAHQGAEQVEVLLQRTLSANPLLAYAAVTSDGRRALRARSDAEGERLRREPQALDQTQEDVEVEAVRSVAGVRLAIARLRVQDAGLAVGLSLARQGAELRGGLWSLLLACSGVATAYGLMLLALLGSVSRRLEQLAAGARRVEDGDLRTRVGTPGGDELGFLGRAFDTATERLALTLGQVQSTAVGMQRTARDVAEAADQVRRGTASQVSDIDEATQAARELIQAQALAARQTESVRDETRLTAGVAQRLAAESQEVATNLEEVERLTSASGEAVRQLHSVGADMARQASLLTDTTAQTASAMQDVKHAITRVRETATSAAGLAEHASLDAERGALVLEGSMAGIEAIREASRAIGGVTDGLQLRVGEIGNVLHLITELTQRTNLLALNASIIAAQAGAEGRGFAVVADEIKDLARRTANSAGNIDSLIQSVAEGAHAARRTAMAGNEAVETGAAQSREAARTLTDILSRLRNWAGMAKSIAAATDDQARGAGQVLRAIQELQGQVVDLAGKATEQTRRGEFLQRQTGKLQEVSEMLTTKAQEMREGSAQVADTLSRLTRALEEMSGGQRNRVAEAERVRGMLEVARRIAGGHRDAVATLDRTVADLKGMAEALSDGTKD